ncbi:MAG TPA: phosphatidate cytidylyltransferase [Longimicrobiales bacterium]|nr:phosphatidate cytidylyltransferase [Longimicrobiales bacterium]
MKDLGARLAVSGVGIPALLFMLHQGGWVLGAPLALMAALGAGEVYRFAECRGTRPFSWIGMPVAAGLVALAVIRPGFQAFAPWALGGLGLVVMVALTLALFSRGPHGSPLSAVAVTLFGVVYAGLPMACMVLLHAVPTQAGWGALHPSPWMGLMVVLLPLAATMFGDSVAYFAGSAWGRRKLFPSVSPAKSWLGAAAGVLGATVAGMIWLAIARSHLPGMPVEGFGAAAALGAVLGVGAILGDLAESLMKREAGMKDSGHLFPGHGGALDRLDALTFTLPMAYALFWVLEVTA